MEREQLLDEAVVAYLEAAEAGQPPDERQWLARYPEGACELAEFIADQQKVRRWTEPLRGLVNAVSVGGEDPYR
ncbi:MAG: hypothetical protein HY000_32825, partial [Planctomycetes bacterium]|nr:hypothetical protein [Planctomycetota bacterium]